MFSGAELVRHSAPLNRFCLRLFVRIIVSRSVERGELPKQTVLLVIDTGSEEQCVGVSIVGHTAAKGDCPQAIDHQRPFATMKEALELSRSWIEGGDLPAAEVTH